MAEEKMGLDHRAVLRLRFLQLPCDLRIARAPAYTVVLWFGCSQLCSIALGALGPSCCAGGTVHPQASPCISDTAANAAMVTGRMARTEAVCDCIRRLPAGVAVAC